MSQVRKWQVLGYKYLPPHLPHSEPQGIFVLSWGNLFQGDFLFQNVDLYFEGTSLIFTRYTGSLKQAKVLWRRKCWDIFHLLFTWKMDQKYFLLKETSFEKHSTWPPYNKIISWNRWLAAETRGGVGVIPGLSGVPGK